MSKISDPSTFGFDLQVLAWQKRNSYQQKQLTIHDIPFSYFCERLSNRKYIIRRYTTPFYFLAVPRDSARAKKYRIRQTKTGAILGWISEFLDEVKSVPGKEDTATLVSFKSGADVITAEPQEGKAGESLADSLP